jgi:type I restriction enzyme S subunit
MKLAKLDLPVMSSWIEDNALRLDSAPYLSGAIEAKILLDRLRVKKEPLQNLTLGGMDGLINPGRISRVWVDDINHGIPFLSSSDILQSDLSRARLIAKSVVKFNPKLIIQEDSTLITRSGTIGRTVYCRREMSGMACSEHVLRVVPDPEKVFPGYIYAYLSSKFGTPLVVSGTYGAIIQHIEPHHIADLPVPRIPENLQKKAHELVTQSGEMRCQAEELFGKSQFVLTSAVGFPPSSDPSNFLGHKASSFKIFESSRLDAFFHNPIAQSLEDWIESHKDGCTTLGEITEDIFDVPPFKHIYVQPGYGVPFFTSGDIFLLERKTNKYLSRTQTKGLEKYIIQKGWLLLARSGQLGGIIGRPQYTDSALDQAATSDHVIRIVPKTGVSTAGFLFSYLASSKVGYPLITRTMSGTSIPALWPKDLKQLKVPIVSEVIQNELDDLVSAAFELRVKATSHEDEARRLVEEFIEEGHA